MFFILEYNIILIKFYKKSFKQLFLGQIVNVKLRLTVWGFPSTKSELISFNWQGWILIIIYEFEQQTIFF